MGHKRIDISHMSHADNMGGHKRIHFLYMSHKSKWRGQPALVQLVPDTINVEDRLKIMNCSAKIVAQN